MKLVVALGALALLAGCTSMPGGGGGRGAHAAHHPGGVAGTTPAPARYDEQMKAMQEMHQKMAAAKTPDERAALMQDHMKTMQGGMAMMGRMRGGMMGGGMGMGAGTGPMAMDAQTMQRRLDMMDMMMQMMMDREGMRPPATR